jgi:hypothetical protein
MQSINSAAEIAHRKKRLADARKLRWPKLAILLLAIALFASSLFADCGEDIGRVAAKYSSSPTSAQQIDVRVAAMTLHERGWTTTVIFLDGISANEIYVSDNGPDAISPNLVRTLCDGYGGTWKFLEPLAASSGRGGWMRSDGMVFVIVKWPRAEISVVTRGWLDYAIEAKPKLVESL